MDKRSERFYDIITLNRWFAVSSLILLVTVIWMVWDDYDRPWKTAQREFFGLDIDSAHAALQEENERIARQGELQKLEADLAQAKEDLSARAADLAEAEANLRILEPHLYRVNQDYAFAKAILDTRRYEFETARATHGKGHAETTRAEEAYRKAEEVAEERRQIDQRVAAERDAAAERLDRLVGHQRELEKQRTRLTAGVKVQRRRLQALQPGLAATIRNLPILDFANPSVKVRQIVLRQFERDYHFADVFRVDRCMTCHMGIDRPDFRDAPQPFTTHPRLDLYLSASSAHPVASYGCTVCHGGKGRATDFVDAAHTPASDEERSRWEYKYGWHRLHHWEHPMFPGDVVESSCRKCHMEQDTIRGAELYNEGKLLYERVGCFNCHITEGFTEEFRRVGPSLAHVADKVTPEWAFHWIEDPTALRPTTRMPRFFGLSNNSDPVSLARSDVEVRSLVAYVFGQSTPQGLVEVPAQHDANEGETLFRTVGCVACHVVDDAQDPGARGRDVGPNLSAVGSKTNVRWLYNWLRNPQKHFPGARMPDLRLTEQEAADVAAFLMTRRGEEPQSGRTFGPLDEAVLGAMVTEKLMERSTADQARERVRSMDTPEQLAYLGERLMAHYGCFGCHDVPGQETGVLIGRDFTGQDAVGDKPLEQVVFGFADIPHTWYDWLDRKLEAPRVFDLGFERKPVDKLRMPKFKLSPHQREALICFLLSLTNEKVPSDSQRRFEDPRAAALNRGETLVREFNCRACHRFSTDRLVFANPKSGKGEPKEIAVRGVVTAVIEETLFFRALEELEVPTGTGSVGGLQFSVGEIVEVELGDLLRREPPIGGDSQDELLWFYAAREDFFYEREEIEEGDEDAVAEWSAFRDAHLHMLPPLLEGQGARTQPHWLFDFLKTPFEMRLQLDVRMPDFSLSDAKARDLVAYFAARDGVDFPFLSVSEQSKSYRESHRDQIVKARKLFDSQDIQCISCHIRGGILPEGDMANWGPDLARTPARLRPEWVIQWLKDPQVLQPGTKMPTFESLTAADRTAMKDFLMNFEFFYPAQDAAGTPNGGAPAAGTQMDRSP